MRRYVVLVGNLSDGYTLTGPFETFDDAATWDDDRMHDENGAGWVMSMDSPSPDREELEGAE